MAVDVGPLTAVLVIAVVTYLTRIGGLAIMGAMSITPRIERMLDALAGSVLVAIVVPAALAGDLAAKAGVVAAVAGMALTRSPVSAMALGMAAAILVRHLG